MNQSTTIPFGKYKDLDFNILYHHEEYVKWLYENCKTTLEKFPEFYEYVKELLDIVPKKEKPYTDFSSCPSLDGMDSNGILINNFDDYKKYVCKLYGWHYLKTKEEDVYKISGKPVSYPFVLTLRKNTMNEFDSVSIHKVYISEKPSYYTFRRSYYD